MGLNACKRVDIRTGMYLFHDVGWFCFVSMKQRTHNLSLHIYIRMYANGNEKNTGHNEVISFDFVVEIGDVYVYCSSICIHTLDR